MDLGAPGAGIWSSTPDGYSSFSGKSMATPHVTGAAALYASVYPGATVAASAASGDGQTANCSFTVTVMYSPPPPASSFTLTASGFKTKGVQSARLNWSGATTTTVDVYRNNSRVATPPSTTAGTGTFTDNLGTKGAGTYVYKVCDAGTTRCSNTSTVAF